MRKEEFIKRSKCIHGEDSYSYDFIEEEVNWKEKIKIKCNKHNTVFDQTISNHISNKRGCPICSNEDKSSKLTSNTYEFIEKSNKKHNGIYTYENTSYVRWNVPVNITCKLHGDFSITPNKHLNGQGCKKCFLDKRTSHLILNNNLKSKLPKNLFLVRLISDKLFTLRCNIHGEFDSNKLKCEKCILDEKKANFIKDSVKIHGCIYDYTKVEYISTDRKVSIICKSHGEFLQTPHHHKNGNGCPVCSLSKMGNKGSFANFVAKSNNVYSNKFDYSKSIYINSKTKLIVICPKHGEFTQTPEYHLTGRGCVKCNYEESERSYIKNPYHDRKPRKKLLKYITEEYIEICKSIHGNKYFYDNIEFNGMSEYVNVVCPKHGEFEINAWLHTNGSGCKYCGVESRKIGTDEILNRFKILHKGKYDYNIDEISKYKTMRDKISITCREHGKFIQNIETHMKGSGCPKCFVYSRGESYIKGFLTDNNISHIEQFSTEDCKFINKLKFDFYIESINICIEFDGYQHYKPVSFFGGEKSLKKQIIRDNIKDEWCIKNNIELVRISYKDFRNISNMDKILEKIKQKYNDKQQT